LTASKEFRGRRYGEGHFLSRKHLKTSVKLLQSYHTVRSESRCALKLRYVDPVVSIEVDVEVRIVSLYSVVKQRLKCNTGKVCNSLVQVLLTTFL
jgi:hypothetical protein